MFDRIAKPKKKAKKVKVKFIEVPTTRIEAQYTCPNCNCGFQDLNGWNGGIDVVRFKCSRCKQELIIDR